MTRPIQLANGRLNGSIGDGRDTVPTTLANTTAPVAPEPASASTSLADVLAVLAPKLPATLSASSMNTFRKCPKLFYFTRVLRQRTPGSLATVKGTLAHRVLEDLWNLPADQRTPDRAATLADQHWAELRDEPGVQEWLDADPKYFGDSDVLAHTREMLTGYFTLEDTTGDGTVEFPGHAPMPVSELHVQTSVAGGDFQGFIDRVEMVVDTGTGELSYRVVDYKTGKLPAREKYMDDYWFQMVTYASLLRQQYGITVTDLRLVYLQGAVYDKRITDTDLDAHDALLGQTAAEVRQAHATDTWPAKPEYLCGWCHFAEQCDEYQSSGIPRPKRR